MYKNVIFDADGTLLDTLPGIYAGFNYVMEHFKKPALSAEQVKPFMGPSLTETFTVKLGFNPKDTEKAVRLYRDFYWDKGYRMCGFFPGIPELLNRLKAEQKILSVATNKPQPFIDLILKEKGYYDIFAVVAGADLSESSTDKTPLILKARQDTNAVMVGDRYVDITAALNAGVDSIGVLWGSCEPDEFIKYPPNFIAENPGEVYTIVTGK